MIPAQRTVLGNKSGRTCTRNNLARNVEPEIISIFLDREPKVCSGLIVVNWFRVVEAAGDGCVLFMHMAQNNTEVFFTAA